MKQRKKGMQDIDVTKKERANELSDKKSENVSGGVIVWNPKGYYNHWDGMNEFLGNYVVLNDQGEIQWFTRQKDVAVDIARKNNWSDSVVSINNYAITPELSHFL